jgi:hypothetical protein
MVGFFFKMKLTTGNNYIYLTLTESVEFPDEPNLIKRINFTGESNVTQSCTLQSNLSSYPKRYDKYLIQLQTNPNTNINQIDLKKGSYYFTVTYTTAQHPMPIIIERGWADVIIESDNFLVNSPSTTYAVNV